MAKEKVKSENKKNLEKSTEYPEIYLYIYERETSDINRLHRNFKNTRTKKITNAESGKLIIGYELQDGNAIPIYKKITGESMKVKTKATAKKSVSVKAKHTPSKSTMSVKKHKIK